MRITQPCMKCWPPSLTSGTFDAHLYQEKNLYKFTCSAGHVNYAALTNPKFEILSDIALSAFLDQYYLQCVGAFASSLERSMEWFTRLGFHKIHGDFCLFDEAWKKVRRQSERQIGLFIAIYATITNENPPVLPDDIVAFRNNVTHNGYLPSEIEAKKFSQAVINTVFTILDMARVHLPAQIVEENFRRTTEQHLSVPDGENLSTICLSTCFGLSSTDSVPREFDSIVERHRVMRTLMGSLRTPMGSP